MRVTEHTSVYIAAPANLATGGPELLHQFAHTLRQMHVNAVMYYKPDDRDDPAPPQYASYEVPFVRAVDDSADNILIMPEVYGRSFESYSHIQKALWWLSVDNYYNKENVGSRAKNKKSINAFLTRLGFNHPLFFLKSLKTIDLHLVQSHYASVFLKNKGVKYIAFLTDYLNDDFLSIETPREKKEDIIAYNPRKGYAFTKKIIAYDPSLKFVPIKDMSRQEVIELLQKAKVYIDFGNHPGKDRIPREAAILNCCIITGQRGSAKYFEDIAIDDKYKFADKKSSIPQITRMIHQCIDDYDNEAEHFVAYKERILNEKNVFLQEVHNIFSDETQHA
jgi:hypothetical protein